MISGSKELLAPRWRMLRRRKPSFTDFLSRSSAIFFGNPGAISVQLLEGAGLTIVSAMQAFFLVFCYAILKLAPPTEASLQNFISSANLLLKPFILATFLAFVFGKSVAESIIFNYLYDLVSRGEASIERAFRHGFRNLASVFVVELLVMSAAFGPILIVLLVLPIGAGDVLSGEALTYSSTLLATVGIFAAVMTLVTLFVSMYAVPAAAYGYGPTRAIQVAVEVLGGNLAESFLYALFKAFLYAIALLSIVLFGAFWGAPVLRFLLLVVFTVLIDGWTYTTKTSILAYSIEGAVPKGGERPFEIGRYLREGLSSIGSVFSTKSGLASLFLTLLFFALGFAVGYDLYRTLEPLGAATESVRKAIIGDISSVPRESYLLFINIFLNNLTVLVMVVYSSVLYSFLCPLGTIMYNGIVIGFFYPIFTKVLGVEKTVAGLVPHGIPELFAIFAGASLAIRSSLAFLVSSLKGEDPIAVLSAEYKRAVKALFVLALILLLAAFIEAFITPIVMESV